MDYGVNKRRKSYQIREPIDLLPTTGKIYCATAVAFGWIQKEIQCNIEYIVSRLIRTDGNMTCFITCQYFAKTINWTCLSCPCWLVLFCHGIWHQHYDVPGLLQATKKQTTEVTLFLENPQSWLVVREFELHFDSIFKLFHVNNPIPIPYLGIWTMKETPWDGLWPSRQPLVWCYQLSYSRDLL